MNNVCIDRDEEDVNMFKKEYTTDEWTNYEKSLVYFGN